MLAEVERLRPTLRPWSAGSAPDPDQTRFDPVRAPAPAAPAQLMLTARPMTAPSMRSARARRFCIAGPADAPVAATPVAASPTKVSPKRWRKARDRKEELRALAFFGLGGTSPTRVLALRPEASTTPGKWLADLKRISEVTTASELLSCMQNRVALRQHPMIEESLGEWWVLAQILIAADAKENSRPARYNAKENSMSLREMVDAWVADESPTTSLKASPGTAAIAADAAAPLSFGDVVGAAIAPSVSTEPMPESAPVSSALFVRLYICICKALLPQFDKADARKRARQDARLHCGASLTACMDRTTLGDALFEVADAFCVGQHAANRPAEYAPDCP